MLLSAAASVIIRMSLVLNFQSSYLSTTHRLKATAISSTLSRGSSGAPGVSVVHRFLALWSTMPSTRAVVPSTSDSAFWIETTRVLKGCVLEVLQRL